MSSAYRLILVAVVLFGGAWPITKAAMVDATPMWFAVGRAALAGVVIGLLAAMRGNFHLPRRDDLPAMFCLGLLQLGGFFALAHPAVALTNASRTAVISAVTTYWLIPLSMIVLGEKVSGVRWLAAAFGLAGVAALAGPWAVDWSQRDAVLGHAMLVGASLLWSIAIVATRRWPPRTPMIDLLPWCFALGTLVLLPIALWLEPAGGIGPDAWPHMLYIGLIAAPIGTWCVVEVGRRLPGAVSSVALLLVPAFGVILSAVWLGEPIGLDVILGGLLIVVSVVLATSS